MALQHKPQPGDDRLKVRFYKEHVLMGFETEQKGYPVFETFDFVSIQVPGDIGNEICRKASENDKERFLPLWSAYVANQDQKLQGTPLDKWLEDEKLLHLLKYLEFSTVEQVAHASDSQLQRVGMGSFELRTRAQAFLDAKNGTANVEEMAVRLKALEEKLAGTEDAPAEQTEAPARRGRRPRVSEHVQDAA